MDEQALETELFAIGSRLAADMPVQRNPLKAIDDKAMDLAAQDAELKAALFRFVDVVPACRSLEDLARHLKGFLGEVGEPPVTQSEAQRYAERCAEALETIVAASRRWPERPQLEHDSAGPLPRAN